MLSTQDVKMKGISLEHLALELPVLSEDSKLARLSEKVFEEFHKRRDSAERHHDPRIAQIKPSEVQKWFLQRERESESKKKMEEDPRQEKRLYEAFKSLERNGLIMLAPGSADEYVLTSTGEKTRQVPEAPS